MFMRVLNFFPASSDEVFFLTISGYQTFCFQCFFSNVKSFLILYVVYRSTHFWVVLKESDYPPARCWPCLCRKSVSDLRRLEKKWDFWDSHDSWTLWWNVVGTYMKEHVYFSLLVEFPGEYSLMSIWVEFFHPWTRFWFEVSSSFFLPKRLQFGSKTDLTTNGFILKFLFECASFRHCHMCLC